MSPPYSPFTEHVIVVRDSLGVEAVGILGMAIFFGALFLVTLAMRVVKGITQELAHQRNVHKEGARGTAGKAGATKGHLHAKHAKDDVDDKLYTKATTTAAPKGVEGSRTAGDAPDTEIKYAFSRPECTSSPDRVLKGYRQELLTLVASPSSFVTASRDRTIRFYTSDTNHVNVPLHNRTVSCAGYSDNGAYVAMYFREENSVAVYNSEFLNRELFLFRSTLPSDVSRIHIVPNATAIVTISGPANLEVHSGSGALLDKRAVKIGRATAWACHKYFIAVSGTEVDDVRFLEIVEKSGTFAEVKSSVTHFMLPRCRHIHFLSDWTVLAINEAGVISTWKIDERMYSRGASTLKMGRDFIDEDFNKNITTTAVSPDGRYVALACGPHFTVYGIQRGTEFQHLRDYHHAHDGTVIDQIVFAPSGNTVLTVGVGEKVVKGWYLG